jgi:hypothetical protein
MFLHFAGLRYVFLITMQPIALLLKYFFSPRFMRQAISLVNSGCKNLACASLTPVAFIAC